MSYKHKVIAVTNENVNAELTLAQQQLLVAEIANAISMEFANIVSGHYDCEGWETAADIMDALTQAVRVVSNTEEVLRLLSSTDSNYVINAKQMCMQFMQQNTLA